MSESDIPLTAVSTPSGMPWQWLVMPQGLKNAPATFHSMVSQVLRPLRDIAPTYFNDIFAHSRGEGDLIEFLVYLQHLKRLLQVIWENKLHVNLKKYVFCAPELTVLGCYVIKSGVRADSEKSRPSVLGPHLRTPRNYVSGLAWQITCTSIQTTTKEDATWSWRSEQKTSLWRSEKEPGVSASASPIGRLQAITRRIRCKLF